MDGDGWFILEEENVMQRFWQSLIRAHGKCRFVVQYPRYLSVLLGGRVNKGLLPPLSNLFLRISHPSAVQLSPLS